MDDPYQVLGIAPGASLEEAEAAFRARLHEVHPDRHPDAEGTEASAHAAETARITEAIRELRYRLREVREVHRCRACGAPVDTAVARCPVCGDDPSAAPWWHGPPPGEVPAASELGGGTAWANRDWGPQPHSGGIGVIVVTLLALLLFAAIYWGVTQFIGGR